MATEKRLIDANETINAFTNWLTSRYDGRLPRDVVAEIPTVDAVPVDEIIFHHILIDENGIPEVKLQLGERTLILRREDDPVDAMEVVRCKDCKWYDPECETCTFWDGIRHPEHFCGEGLGKDNAV